MAAFGWKLKGDGHRLAPGEVVAPDERLSWGTVSYTHLTLPTSDLV